MNLVQIFFEILLGIFVILAVRYIGGKKLDPKICRLLWMVVIFRALVPFSLPIPYHPAGLLPSWSEAARISPVQDVSIPSEPERNFVSNNVVPPSPGENIPDGTATSHVALESTTGTNITEQKKIGKREIHSFLFGLWLLGFTAVLSMALLRNRRIINRSMRQPTPVPDWVQEIFLELREKLRLGTWPVLIVTPYVPTPCLVGAVRPRILIPESLIEDDTDHETVRFMLLHEMTHLKSGDIWLSWLWTFTLAVHWFNPLFWLLGRSVKYDCETACDERVLEFLDEKAHRQYAESLIHIMEALNPRPIRVAGLSAVIETSSNLERRLDMMNSRKTPTWKRSLAGFTILVLLAVFTLTGYGGQKNTPISAKKARLMGYVENYFVNNFTDIKMRQSLSWGEVETNEDGSNTIRYGWEALMQNGERIVDMRDFTFDKKGSFVSVKQVQQYSNRIGTETAKASPGDSQKATRAGWILLYRSEFTEAERKFQEAVKLDPKNADAYNGLGWSLLHQGLTIEAKESFAKCLELAPENVAALNGVGQIARSEGDDKTMLDAWLKAVEVDKGVHNPLIGLAKYYEEKGDKKNAAKYYKIWIEADPADKNAKAGLERTNIGKESGEKITPEEAKKGQRTEMAGWQLFHQWKFDEAEEKFQEAVKLNSKSARAYQGLGWSQLNQGLPLEAKESFEKCVELDPKNAAALNGLAQIARSEGDEEAMLRFWLKAITVDKSATGPMLGLATYYEEKGDKKNAVKYYKMLSDADPTDEHAKAALERMNIGKKSGEKTTPEEIKKGRHAEMAGWQLFGQWKFDEAKEKFQEAVKLNPKSAGAYQGLGWAQLNTAEPHKAKATFAKCLELDPKNVAAFNGIGQIARHEGDTKTMLNAWHKAVDASKEISDPLIGLAKYYEEVGDKENAAKYYKIWSEAAPNDKAAREGLKRMSGE